MRVIAGQIHLQSHYKIEYVSFINETAQCEVESTYKSRAGAFMVRDAVSSTARRASSLSTADAIIALSIGTELVHKTSAKEQTQT